MAAHLRAVHGEVLFPPPVADGALSEQEVASLPQANVDELGVDQCAICLRKVPRGTLLTALGCGHGFHGSCTRTWLQRSPTLPCCRAEVASQQPQQLQQPWQRQQPPQQEQQHSSSARKQ
mmetsp:Transcript_20412/g.54881  ORF Transcript_20412/g.54881 Transcript_20412/m.54881 type:complete len:120 (-) Transcript_20412:278-637(-)